jgi:O-antigen ligase
MNNLAMRISTPDRLILLPLAALIVVLSARTYLDIQAGPLSVISAFLATVMALGIAARFPAAFIAPVLFLPRLMEVSAFVKFGPASDWTALQVACALLGSGILFRWLITRRVPRDAEAIQQRIPSAANDVSLEAPASVIGRGILAFLIFAIVVAVSYLYTLSPNYGSDKLVGFLTLGAGLFILPIILFTDEDHFRDFIVGTTMFGMVVAASSLRFSATGAMGIQANPAHIGKGQVIGLAILLLLYSPIANRWLKAFALFVCIPWMALGLVSAETRGPLFSLALVLILSVVVDVMRSPIMSRRQMAFSGAVIVGAIILLSVDWFYGAEASRFRYKSAEIVALLQGSTEAQGTAVERLSFYHAAVRDWLERPIFGWGIGSWSMIYWHQDIRQYPHNLFCEVLVEQGLMGIAALLIFLQTVYRELRSIPSYLTGRFPYLLPCAVYLLSISMFSGDLDDDRFIWFWCGLTLAACTLAQRVLSDDLAHESESNVGNFAAESQGVPNRL